MSEQDLTDERAIATQSAVEVAPGPDVSAPAGYGARLASQRQSAGLSVTDVAASLRLHPNQIRAIEQEDLARLPAPAYVRGFIRSYARVLNIDPAPLLTDLNAKLAPARESVVDGMATDYAAARAAGRERMLPQWAIGIALVVLIALGLIGWQATQQPAPAPAPPEALAVSAAPPTPALALATEATASPAASEASAAPADPIPAPAEVAEPTVRSSVIATGAAPTLVLRFNGASWAEVTDRNGKILLSQLSAAGAEHALDGELPLTVVIGDANFASVEVRGAAFSLQPFTRNNVARFVIK
jgi:cytoskeleton protein RodZ